MDDHGPGARAQVRGDRQPPLLRRSRRSRSCRSTRSASGAAPERSKTLLQDQGLADHPLFAQAKARGIKALAGHAESIDVTNDVNGGPSGIGVATAAGKAAFWDVAGASMGGPKIIAFEGEFAMTEGHAQELKTQALAMKVGKRLRVMISDNNAGIDDSLIGGVIDAKYDGYNLDRAVDLLRLERLRRRQRQRLRPGRHRAEDDGGLGSEGSAADGRSSARR